MSTGGRRDHPKRRGEKGPKRPKNYVLYNKSVHLYHFLNLGLVAGVLRPEAES